MIEFLYKFFLTYQLIACLCNAVLGYRISKMKLSPTLTWEFFSAAFTLRLITYVWGLFYMKDVLKIYDQYDLGLIVLAYFIEAVIMGLMLAFSIRKFVAYRNAKRLIK